MGEAQRLNPMLCPSVIMKKRVRRVKAKGLKLRQVGPDGRTVEAKGLKLDPGGIETASGHEETGGDRKSGIMEPMQHPHQDGASQSLPTSGWHWMGRHPYQVRRTH